MRVTFWGTRGSLPVSLNAAEFRSKAKNLLLHTRPGGVSEPGSADALLDGVPLPHAMTFGGNTPCVEMSEGNEFIILDCGTGLRALGQNIMERGLPEGAVIDIFQTHTHWDHIMGFPFFAPALSGKFRIRIHGVHPGLRDRFEAQMDRIHFPITLNEMKSPVEFVRIGEGDEISLDPFSIKNLGLHHPGGSYAYRVTAGGKTVVFATDCEYTSRDEQSLRRYVEFYRDADMLIFDAMYATIEQTVERMNYGHSTAVIGVDIALAAGVKKLVLFHHDPESDDDRIADCFFRARDYLAARGNVNSSNRLEIVTSYDGLSIDA